MADIYDATNFMNLTIKEAKSWQKRRLLKLFSESITSMKLKRFPVIGFQIQNLEFITAYFVETETGKIHKQDFEGIGNDTTPTVKSYPRPKIELRAGKSWNGFFRSADGARYIYLEGRPVDVCAIPFVSYMLWPSPSGRYAVGYCAETPNKPHFYDTKSKKHIQPSNWRGCNPSNPKAAWISDDTFVTDNCKIDLSASLR